MFGQPAHAGLPDPGRLAVLHAGLLVVPVAVFDPQVFAITDGEGRQVAVVEEALVTHECDELGAGEAEVLGGFFQATLHFGLLGCMRGGRRHGGQVGDGFGDHGVDLHVAPVDCEALGTRLSDAYAQDGGDAGAGFVAVDCQIDRLLKAHVETDDAAGLHQIEYLLFVFTLKHAIAAICVRQRRWVGRGGWPVDDLFNEVCKLEVHLLAVGQGQRVAFASQFNGEVRVGFAAFDFQAEG